MQPTEQNADGPVRELVGHVWVDSGHLVVTDPIYLEELDADAVAEAAGEQRPAARINDGMAFAFRSGIRNTKYPVYATRSAGGALMRVEIVFDETIEGSPSNPLAAD